jgi:hypothetical protein
MFVIDPTLNLAGLSLLRDMLEGRNIRGVIRFTDADRS